jgi:hypothetical protein
MSIVNRSIDIPVISAEGTVHDVHRAEIVDSHIPVTTHHKAIKRLLKRVRKTGFEQQELENGYYIEVTAWDKIAEGNNDIASNFAAQRMKKGVANRPIWCNDANH